MGASSLRRIHLGWVSAGEKGVFDLSLDELSQTWNHCLIADRTEGNKTTVILVCQRIRSLRCYEGIKHAKCTRCAVDPVHVGRGVGENLSGNHTL